MVSDPFKREIGGVPKNDETELKRGVADQAAEDAHKPVGSDPTSFSQEVDLMDAVWGAHFDPHAPATEKADNGQPAR